MKNKMRFVFGFVGASMALFGCGGDSGVKSQETQTETPSQTGEAFLQSFRNLCGKAFAGRLTSNDEVDARYSNSKMIMYVRDCEADVIRIPFHVDDNHSRTWILTKTAKGVRLDHDHRHEDGSADEVTFYGGESDGTNPDNTAFRQDFPVNDYSKELFLRTGLNASVENIWRMEIVPGETFTYQLTRPNRLFRVEFDLSNPAALPPPAWGYTAQ